ncbi:ATP-dependent zinc metalloprotease FtsH [Aquisphaera giovannonii]|uniref:ATP-dependent zinc metalloprotease FtsH n=1 Tax=Aquisphaera giovannonii TaxID=406548 RepID=A0A5B9W4K1_9BACT|nr:ATP-binding protein [Aquisphaera giovannonii]QEH35001.1 ATP-dependent zinc metalloprotease FtsH [Aquisphaera giovannonii]
MARSDLLINLVKAGTQGDQSLFRRTVEAVIAEERGKNHTVLADRLADAASSVRQNGHSKHQPTLFPISNGIANDLYFETTPQRSLEDLVLPKATRDVCLELIEEQHRHSLLRSYSLEPRNRILLAGDPGNGKTSLAEAIAHALMVPLVVVRYDGLIASYLGETASRLNKLFEYVRTRSCVLFFDEFDTIGKERGDVHETGEIKRVVSSLLLQIDALPSHVVVVTATNHPELLDRAVWRRFQLRLELPRPTIRDVEAYFASVEARLKFSLEISPKVLADRLQGASYSELEDFVSDISRRYVLSLPDANIKKIVQQRLVQWQDRFDAKRTS